MGTIFLVILIITIHDIYVCMYVCMYVCILIYVYKYSVTIYLLCMIKFRVRWCTCSMWRMLLPCGIRSVVLSPPLSPFYFVFFQGLSSLAL